MNLLKNGDKKMEIKLHKLARTTPAIRKIFQESTESAAVLAHHYGVSRVTVNKWRKSKTIYEGSQTRKKLGQRQTPLEEALIKELRLTLRLSQSNVIEVMKRCLKVSFSASSMVRCCKRLGISKLPPLDAPTKAKYQKFEEEKCGYLHIDYKILKPVDKVKGNVLVAIDRATRYVIIRQLHIRTAQVTAQALREILEEFPYPVHTILTDNDGSFTDKYAIYKIGKPKGQPSGSHLFDVVCKEYGIKHKLITPYRPQTNGMVERFNRRISDDLSKVEKRHRMSNGSYRRFANAQEREEYFETFVYNYNHTRLKCLGYKSPLEMLKNVSNHEANNTQGWSDKIVVNQASFFVFVLFFFLS